MTEPHLLFDVSDNVAQVTLNRPEKHNSLTPEMVVRLADTWDEVMDRPEIRVVLLTGAGEKSFCSGADLGSLIPLVTRARPPADEWDERLIADPKLANKALLRSTDMTTPIICAVRGYALAGGFELFIASDLRVVADDSRFGLTEVRRGLIPGGGGTARLGRQIPRAYAAEIMLLGDHITAARALEFGLVNRVVPSAEVMACARDLAARMSANGPLAMRKVKETMLRSDGLPIEDAFGLEDDANRIIVRSHDAHEGPRAFMEKRTPQFTGQ